MLCACNEILVLLLALALVPLRGLCVGGLVLVLGRWKPLICRIFRDGVARVSHIVVLRFLSMHLSFRLRREHYHFFRLQRAIEDGLDTSIHILKQRKFLQLGKFDAAT